MNLFEKLNRLDDSLVESKGVVKEKKLTEGYENTLWQDKPIAYEDQIVPKHIWWLFNNIAQTNFFDLSGAYESIKENGITAEQIEQLENVYGDFKQGAASMNALAKRASQILNLSEKEGLSNEVEHVIYDTVQDAYSVGTPDETLWNVVQRKLRGKKYDKTQAKEYFNMCLEQGSDEWYDDYDDHYDYDDDINEMLTESEEKYELSTLVKDSINHLVNDLGKDPMADDFGDDVCADLENNYDIEVPQNMVKYADWCDAVMSEVSRQINKVEE